MKKYLLLFLIVFAACQQEDIFIEENMEEVAIEQPSSKSNSLTSKGEVPEASMGSFATLPQFESVEVLIDGASASWEINQTESIYFSTGKEGNNYINDITMYFSEPVDQEFLRMVFNQDVLTNIAFKYHGGDFDGLPDSAVMEETDEYTKISFTAIEGENIEVFLWKESHYIKDVVVSWNNGLDQDLKLISLVGNDVNGGWLDISGDLYNWSTTNLELKVGETYEVQLTTKYRNDVPKTKTVEYTYNGEGSMNIVFDNYNDSFWINVNLY